MQSGRANFGAQGGRSAASEPTTRQTEPRRGQQRQQLDHGSRSSPAMEATQRRQYMQSIQIQTQFDLPAGAQSQARSSDYGREQRPSETGKGSDSKMLEAKMSQEEYNGPARQLSRVHPALLAEPDILQRPAPTRRPFQDHRLSSWLIPIEPDANPLSPVSPISVPRSPIQEKTTNIDQVTPFIKPAITSPVSSLPQRGFSNGAATAISIPPQPTKGGTWQHDLFSCADPAVCLTTLICPCTTYGKVQHRLSQLAAHKDPTNTLGHTTLNNSCLAFAWTVFCGIGGVLAGFQHSRVRRSYNMDSAAGSCAHDCILGCCCCCCVIAQSEKEIKVREEAARQQARAQLQAQQMQEYSSPHGMTFAPPPLAPLSPR